MAYVIYKPTTWKMFVKPDGLHAIYNTERVTKAQYTKLVNAGVIKAEEWEIATYGDYCDNEPMVTVKSLMNGKDVQIRKSEVGGCCDPSTERYWSI